MRINYQLLAVIQGLIVGLFDTMPSLTVKNYSTKLLELHFAGFPQPLQRFLHSEVFIRICLWIHLLHTSREILLSAVTLTLVLWQSNMLGVYMGQSFAHVPPLHSASMFGIRAGISGTNIAPSPLFLLPQSSSLIIMCFFVGLRRQAHSGAGLILFSNLISKGETRNWTS